MRWNVTFTGGLCLVGIEPVSTYILLEQAAQARDQDTWQERMEQALSGLNCRVIQSTSDEAPGLLAYVARNRSRSQKILARLALYRVTSPHGYATSFTIRDLGAHPA